MAKTPIATIASDTHCVPCAWVGRPELRGDAFYAFELTINETIKRELPLLLAGDIIDIPHPDAETAAFLRRQAQRMRQAKLPWKYVLGNHEQTNPPWLAAVHDWPENISGRADDAIGDLKLYGLNFTPFDRLPEELAKVPEDTDVFLCHQAWEEFMGRLMRSDGSLGLIPAAKLVITGDYHVYKTMSVTGSLGRPMQVLSPGSTTQTTIDEVEPRRFHILYDDLTTSPVKLPGRPQLAPPPLVTEEDLENFLRELDGEIAQAVDGAKRLPEHLRKPILRVTYHVTIPNVYSRLKEAIGDKAHFFRKEERPERVEQEQTREKKRSAVQAGLVGCLEEEVPDRKSPLYRFTRRLLEEAQTGEKPDKVLAKLREEFLGTSKSDV